MPVIINELDVIVNEPAANTSPRSEPTPGPPVTALDLIRVVEQHRQRVVRLEAD